MHGPGPYFAVLVTPFRVADSIARSSERGVRSRRAQKTKKRLFGERKERKRNGKMGGDDETVECDACSMEVRVASCALRVVRGDVLCAACAACELGRAMRASLHI